MNKLILITAFAATLQAQSNFQNPAWLGGPASSNAHNALQPDGQPNPIIGKPFSGVETRETKQVLSDGTQVSKKEVSKVYRDGEGRLRSESSNTVMLFDPTTHGNYAITKRGCTKSPVHEGSTVIVIATDNGTHSSSRSSSPTAKPNPNIAVEDLGFQVVNGISAKGTRQTLTIPAKTLGSDHDVKVVNERWYSDSLGILIKSSNLDPRFGSTTYELTSLNQSSPDPSLFSAPTGCTDQQFPGMMPPR